MTGHVPSVIAYCTACGSPLDIGAQYCGQCGQPATPPKQGVYPVATTPTAVLTPYMPAEKGFGKLFSASGRIGRLEYFVTSIAAFIGGIIGWLMLAAFGGPTVGALLGLGLFIVCSLVSIFAGIKRLHDFDQSGWLILVSLVPLVGWILGLVMLFKGPSSGGPNQYGYEGSGSPF